MAQLSKLRAEAGQTGPPDMDEEDKLRCSVKSLEGERDRLAQAHEQLAQSILDMATQVPASTTTPTTTPGELFNRQELKSRNVLTGCDFPRRCCLRASHKL